MAESDAGTAGDVRVWDLPTRLFHWALVVLVLASYLTGEFWRGIDMSWHMWSGYAILALVLFRLLWGAFGTRHARFADFVRGPARISGYLRDLLRGRAAVYSGHNPLGGLSVLAFLAVLLVQAGSGLFASDDIFVEGPLAGLVSSATVDLMTSVHHFTFDLLIGLVALHLAAVAFYEGARGQRLVRGMVTGRKPRAAREVDHARAAPSVPLATLRGAGLLAVSAGAVAALVWGLPALAG
jgi:cytochrome b